MPVKPVRDLLYIIPIEDPMEVKGGKIILHEKAKQRVDHGIVKYKGPKVKDIKIGDHVLFSGWAGTRIALSDEGTLISIEEEWIEGIWTKGPPSRVFTEQQIRDWIRGSCNKLALRGYAGPVVNEVEEELRSYVDSAFEAESLLF